MWLKMSTEASAPLETLKIAADENFCNGWMAPTGELAPPAVYLNAPNSEYSHNGSGWCANFV